MLGNGELLQQAVGLVPLGFGPHTSCARFTILLDEFVESGPGIVATDEINGFILTGVSGKYVIMFVPQNTEP